MSAAAERFIGEFIGGPREGGGSSASVVRREAWAAILQVVVLLSILTLGATSFAASSTGPSQHNGRLTISATQDKIGSSGADPSAISLNWTQTGDLFFTKYVLAFSFAGSNGPWYVWANITGRTATSYVAIGLNPGTTYWWSIFDCDIFGCQQGNALQAAQPTAPSLTFSQPTETSATLTWTNPATYGGGLAFQSYTVMESINGAVYTAVSTITAASNPGYSATGLSQPSVDRFYVATTDTNTLTSTTFIASTTNPVSVSPPALLTASALASPTLVDLGQSITFNCSGTGGVPPLSYSWTFGDAQTGTGSSASHTYTSAGTYTATCTTTDSQGVKATATATAAVNTDPSATLSPAALSILQGQSVSLTVSASGGTGPYSYSWSGLPPGCSVPTGPTLTCTPSATGTFVIQVTATDGKGISASAGSNVMVNPSFIGMPAVQGYAVVGGGIAAIVIIAGVAAVVLSRRRKRGKTVVMTPQESQPRPPPGSQ